MDEVSDFELLRRYSQHESEDAFGVLLTRHVNLVYSVALRRLGDHTAAKDVTQVVFATLARKAGQLSNRVILSGWLFQVTTHACENMRRAEARRKRWESEAVREEIHSQPESSATDMSGDIAVAMDSLRSPERDAILLRYFDARPFHDVAARLGISEAAAKMRVTRALEKLRRSLDRRGVDVSASALSAVLPQLVQPAPSTMLAGIAASVAGSTHSASETLLLKGVLNAMAWTKAKSAIAGAVIVASVLAPLFIQWRAQARLSERDISLHHQAEALRDLQDEYQELSASIGQRDLAQDELIDLERLRAQMPALRRADTEVQNLRASNRQLQSAQNTPQSLLQVKERMIARSSFTYEWTLALVRYAKAHGGVFPENLEQAAPFLNPQAAKRLDLTPDLYELVYHGPVSALANPAKVILLREKEPWQTTMQPDPNKGWVKYYGYADGSVNLHTQPTNNFDAWESQHAPPGLPH